MEIAWVDKKYMHYKMSEISNRYLLNILGFMCKGGGYSDLLTTDKICKLFDEAHDRRLDHDFNIADAVKNIRLKQKYEEEKMDEELRKLFADPYLKDEGDEIL